MHSIDRLRGALAVTLFVCAGCPHYLGPREPDQYDGCASNEHWVTFDRVEKAATVDGTRAPWFTAPAAGATVPGAPSPRFAWQPSPSATGRDFGDATCAQCTICGQLAAQHLPPITGTVYDLQLTVDEAIEWRVLSTLQVWTPPDDLWASWRGKQVSLRAWELPLDDNQATMGVFTSASPLVFEVAQ